MIRWRARFVPAVGLSVILALAAGLGQAPTRAATPTGGTLSSTSGPVTWTGFSGPAAVPQAFVLGAGVCTEGTDCDFFELKLAPGDYVGKRVRVRLTWANELNDFDLYVHSGSKAGPVVADQGDSPPETVEEDTFDINRVVLIEETYYVKAVYFAVIDNDRYTGAASVETIPVDPSRTATFIKGDAAGIKFSKPRTVYATGANSDAEPSARVDYQGNAYAGGIRGVPAGNDLWRFDLNPGSPTYDPFLTAATALFDTDGSVVNPSYKGVIDAIHPDGEPDLGADGGGDLDLAVGFKARLLGAPDDPPTLAATSLVAANVSSQRSFDRGETFMRNPAGNTTVQVDDREWNEFLDGDIVYLAYRQFTGTTGTVEFYVNQSVDGGLTYGPATVAAIGGNITGNIDVDQRDGTVYFARQGAVASQVRVAIGRTPNRLVAPVVYQDVIAATGKGGIGNLFPVVKVADDGTVYVAYSDAQAGIYIAHSMDQGRTWSKPVLVSSMEPGSAALMPWIETGRKPGSLAIAWYGAEPGTNETLPNGQKATGNSDGSNWRVYFAQTTNAKDQNPTIYQDVVSDKVIHGSNISVLGLGGAANRGLLDFFQIAVDPQGLAFIAFASTANDFNGHTYVTHQTKGISLTTGKRAHINGPDKEPKPPVDPEVRDWKYDWRIETRPTIMPEADHPADILTIDYGCEKTLTGQTLITATMKTSGLTSVPPDSWWRINFASNPSQAGVSDRADQWFMRADSSATGVQMFTYGTAVRASTGGVVYTTHGSADEGAFDLANRTVTLKVDIAKLNAHQTRGLIGPGATFIGLRGSALSLATFLIPIPPAGVAPIISAGIAQSDQTRGGSSFTLGSSCF
jgi:hypothetical protein